MISNVPPIINEVGNALLVISEVSGEDYINEKLLSGREGELIFKLFTDAGLKAKEFSFAAAIDCEDSSFSECVYRLKMLIDNTKPDYIISMGNTALVALTKKSGIKKYRGQTLSLHESFGFPCIVYPTYSITDLRNVPTFKRTMVADLRNTQQHDEADAIEFSYWS